MTRVAINGFGRIGRNFLRAYLERRPWRAIVDGSPRVACEQFGWEHAEAVPAATERWR
jgi:glyceraldehyde-3-phosphate dehydrogenase/erythrose-4-phosphate dehydrogenase